ncbi:MAG: bile acid:sodium symporter [Labilithrix sp.]|nr:bile acid:sodium symporter [Labilithrix sp.]MCW5815482.1 bile acid:sodium symporter [Labilithrix sp.]
MTRDPFLGMLLGAVALASVLPARGGVAEVLERATAIAVALLFFLHGAKLSREAIKAGIGHVRLHAFVFTLTFVVFPLVGLAVGPIARPLVGPTLYQGFLFLSALPATVQSALVVTAIARGNIAAAVCSASASSILGIFLTPLLVRLLIADAVHGPGGKTTLTSVRDIALQLLLPFVIGHLSRPLWLRQIERLRGVIKWVDQSVIVLIAYVAFSDAVNKDLWHLVPPASFAGIFVVSALILAIMLVVSQRGARLLGFDRADEITIVFGGSKKSLTSGIAMANVIFAGQPIGIIVLPLLVFHQFQLMVCTVLARRWAKRADP